MPFVNVPFSRISTDWNLEDIFLLLIWLTLKQKYIIQDCSFKIDYENMRI